MQDKPTFSEVVDRFHVISCFLIHLVSLYLNSIAVANMVSNMGMQDCTLYYSSIEIAVLLISKGIRKNER